MNETIPAWSWSQRARSGAPDHFSHLVARHQQGLRAFLRRLCGNHALADDLAQETFVAAWKAMDRFDPTRDFRPWLYGIGWRKYREQRRSWLRLLKREKSTGALENSIMIDPGLRLDLEAAMKALPAEQRAAALLCLGCEFTHAEAAQVLELPLGTIKSHVKRAREKLQAALEAPNDR